MKGKASQERKEAALELDQSIHMVKAPASLQKGAETAVETVPQPQKMKVKVKTAKLKSTAMEM